LVEAPEGYTHFDAREEGWTSGFETMRRVLVSFAINGENNGEGLYSHWSPLGSFKKLTRIEPDRWLR
jgi:hypothetical protein